LCFAFFGICLNLLDKIPGLVDIFSNIKGDIYGTKEIAVMVFTVFYSLTLFIMAFSATVRRLHDRGISGWWTLLNLIPYLGVIVIVFICGVLKGEARENKYGPSPI
jgi:uncharacterized membrane protein YhaH (DUF805 family)